VEGCGGLEEGESAVPSSLLLVSNLFLRSVRM
jgi:hypothetical protein